MIRIQVTEAACPVVPSLVPRAQVLSSVQNDDNGADSDKSNSTDSLGTTGVDDWEYCPSLLEAQKYDSRESSRDEGRHGRKSRRVSKSFLATTSALIFANLKWMMAQRKETMLQCVEEKHGKRLFWLSRTVSAYACSAACERQGGSSREVREPLPPRSEIGLQAFAIV
ncbi:hypothetical protein FPCIR_3683 [Fusarium pseudocircinatum]|uniref:Uncharacterized protein n=1 Tax=Fusarium pseudocircinatum TaxID=56676 RepID=A0A8H5US11_9HYPO|nr:hypothetical protein FPCIR_3683 [Fusarium pseudocircinatum]